MIDFVSNVVGIPTLLVFLHQQHERKQRTNSQNHIYELYKSLGLIEVFLK